ncbi:family 2 encapsulin nanocompartment cargo protein terpene cyclase [Nocardia sp. CDC153]|uniref:family 2 encapsulin nanocompartment cargo protein terpene cyclase n=1 Tax=Nocardia sp. CDC153 TaxID=3112167 RepID=UPI002DBDD898|nr:family 2 encapsulin nanocompartment cargo protein terpene cyclase [Nocardia sp. CDC153]MEC3958909.1 family 2 encapsulin nanocompartment cargo protein terpene cyclase [Nocardia sp. CDC153]
MSVLSRAAAPPATSEVAAAVAALLTNLDTAAPPVLLVVSDADASEAAAALDDPRLGAPESAETHTPRRLLGPSGLGAPSLVIDLPTPQAITELAGQASRPPSPAGGAVPTPPLPKPTVPQALRRIPRGLGSARLPAPPTEPPTAVTPPPEGGRPARRIANGPTGIGTTSANRRAGKAAPPAPTTALAAAPEDTSPADAATILPDPKRAAAATVDAAQAVPISVAARPGTASPATGRVSPGGTGTRSAARASAIPALYCPPPVRDNPVLAEAVNVGIIAWAEEIGLYEGRLDDLRKADFGRLIMLAHPDCDDADRLLAAAKCAVSEWSVDDYYCEEDASDIAPDGSRSSAEAELGPRLELAAAAMDPVHLPARYQVKVEEALQSDPILRAFRTSFEHLSHFATPAQVARLRTEIAGWFIALGAEAGWRAAKRMPPVWEYLLNRQPHSFLPCMAPIDAVGGYELSAAEYTDPRMRRVTTTAALAAQMVNDLYSMAREDLSNGREFNLPTVLAAEERCSRREAVQRTAEVHDELMHRFEAEASLLAATGSPELRRFLTGLWAWMGGNRAWHADSRRYQDD